MGKAGSGKDTVAEILHRLYGIKPLTLADPIRAEYRRFFEGNPRTDRARMIQIGQSYKQLYGEDVWIRLLLKSVERSRFSDQNYMVTDGRHQLEYDVFVTQMGYLPIWVKCPDEVRYSRLMKRDGTLQEEALKNECQDLWNAHALTIDNSGTLEDLEYVISEDTWGRTEHDYRWK
jgi:dephospho-CoA kinase